MDFENLINYNNIIIFIQKWIKNKISRCITL